MEYHNGASLALSMCPQMNPRILLCLLLYICVRRYCFCKHEESLSAMRREYALRRRRKNRIQWSDLQQPISDNHFRRMFRMSRDCFKQLCAKIIASIGESRFKSEVYIKSFFSPDAAALDRMAIMHNANLATTGGFISGEVKLALLFVCWLVEVHLIWLFSLIYLNRIVK